jgi:glycyl-tRNA synthetase beta chain
MDKQDFLLEIGCEELPPLTLKSLAQAINTGLCQELKTANLEYQKSQSFATPRRLAILVQQLNSEQPAQTIEKLGPTLDKAYDAEGRPTPACEGFARACGVKVDELQVKDFDKGQRLFYPLEQNGNKTIDILAGMIERTLKKLALPKAMRWGDHTFSFVRPVHWVLCLYGSAIVPCEIFGIPSSNQTKGHRFLAPRFMPLDQPSSYASLLHEKAYVFADFEQRKEFIRNKLNAQITTKERVIYSENLLEEVTALVEWPVILKGNIPSRFLKLPKEVLVTSLETHQKCFAIENEDGQLQPSFVLVSNIESKQPEVVIKGNERVINARLSDAAFFFAKDSKHSLESHLKQLDTVIFQKQLGSIGEKTKRIAKIAAWIAEKIQCNPEQTYRAGLLAKCDLVTEMVYEFPQLQGIMGYYYALQDQEPATIANAIKEPYYPRFAGDSLPESNMASAVALADRLDSLVGILGINQTPTADKDPYALRRMAQGIFRILIEKELNLDLPELLRIAKESYVVTLPNEKVLQESYDFILARLRSWYLEQNVAVEVFEAVLAKNPTSPLDFHQRICAVQNFQKLPESQALAAANKRVSNILKKQAQDIKISTAIDSACFELPEEKTLVDQLQQAKQVVDLYYENKDYPQALTALAQLKQPVDHFFDKVMVMVENPKVRDNRLSILAALQNLMMKVADISLLPQ